MIEDICRKNHGGNPQSKVANGRTNKDRDSDRILTFLGRNGSATCDEVERYTVMSHQTCSARFADLKRAGLIEPTTKRKTRTGCMAMAWRKVKR